MPTEIGTAYISISGRTDGLRADIEKALNGVDKHGRTAGDKLGTAMAVAVGRHGAPAGKKFTDEFRTTSERVGAGVGLAIGRSIGGGIRLDRALLGQDGVARKAGAKLGNVFGTALTGALGIGSAAVAGGLGAVLFKGFDRLKTIDSAKFKLKALGKSTAEIADTVKTVTDSVTGTPFSLDAAFATAVQAIGAGTKDIKGFMTAVSDAAGFAGTDIDRMGLIFNQVLAKGKLTGEEMMQLMEAGLPAKSWIMDSAHLTSQQFDDMQAKGEITFQMLEDSVERHAGGMAKKLGESLQGAIDQIQTAAGRLGADLITAMSGGDPKNLTAGINTVTEQLNKLDGWVKTHVPEITRAIEQIGSAFIDAGTGALEMYKLILKGQEALTRVVANTSFGEARKNAFADADQMREDIKSIDDLIDKNKKNKKSWEESEEAVANVAAATRDLGTAIKTAQADTDGGVILKAPTVDDLNSIDEAKYRIEQIPGTKDFKVIPKTEEATTALDAWRDKEANKTVNIGTKLGENGAEKEVGDWRLDEQGSPVRIPIDADTSPAQATIDAWTTLVLGQTLTIPVQTTGSPSTGNPILDAIPPTGGDGRLIGPGAGGAAQPRLPTGGTGGPGGPASSLNPLIGGAASSAPSPASVAGIARAQALNGMPYTPGTLDCSGYVSQVYSAMVGRNVHFTTMADFEALGFHRGFMPGALNIGNIPRPGNSGHMAATLPNGVNIESGGGGGGVRYGSGPGAMGEQFTEQWYFMPGMASGGGVNGPGSGTSDSIPAWLSNGEHVLTTKDVAAMGGQQGVYAFRQGLHRSGGGDIPWMAGQIPRLPVKPRGKIGTEAGQRPDLHPGPGYPGVIGLPKWGTPGTTFGPPPESWWTKPVDPDDILFPDWLNPGDREGVRKRWRDKRIKPLGFATGGAVATAAIPPGDPRARAGDPAYDPRQGKRKGGGRGYPPSWWPWGIPGTRRPSWHGDIPWWQFPGGKPPGFAEGGAVGPVNGRQLTPEQLQWLQGQGIDPATIMMGGDPPQEMPGAQEFIDSQPSADATGRTQGYIPAGAGYTGKTGGGLAGSFFNLAAEGINGAIDMAAQAASMGAGIAAPGAGAGIGIGADMAKRGVSYAAEMAGIGVGALSEILLPFGAPRWLSDVDPTSFMPHSGVQAVGTTTAEQAVLDQQAQGSQVDPNTMQHGQGMGAAPGPTDPAAFIPPAPPVDAAAMTPAEVRGGDTIHLYPKDVDESFRLLEQRQKLNAMQYGGRP